MGSREHGRERSPMEKFFSRSHTQFFYTFAPAGIIMTLNYAWGWMLAVMATLDWALVHTPMDDRMMVYPAVGELMGTCTYLIIS